MDSITRNLVSKTVSTKKLMYTAFTTQPTEIQLEILDYIPRKVVFQPNELVYLKHFYIYFFCHHLGDELWMSNDITDCKYIFFTNHLIEENDENEFYSYYDNPEDDSCMDTFFELVPDNLRKDIPFMNRLIEKSPNAQEYVIEPMTEHECESMVFTKKQFDYYRKFALHTVKRCDDYSFKHVSDELKRDSEFILAFLDKHWLEIDMEKYVSEDLRDDHEFMLAAIQYNSFYAKFASNRLRNDHKFMFDLTQNDIDFLEFASNRLKKNRKFILTVVQQCGLTLEYASDKLKNDREIVLAAVQQDGLALEYASDKLKNDREIVLAAVQQDGLAFVFAPDELKEDYELVSLMDKWKNDREIVLAVQKYCWALKYASERLKNDREIVLAAVQKYRIWAFEDASDELKKDREFILAAVQQYGWDMFDVFKYASDELKNDHEFWNALQYDSCELKKDRNLQLVPF
jgi:hypothetical protein